jgi:hypothetical protein
MARIKVTHMRMKFATSPASSGAMYSSTDFDKQQQYTCASSQASSNGGVFEENNLYRLDFTCPHCANWSYVVGEHFYENRYIVAYDFIQTSALEYDPSMTEEVHPSVEQQYTAPPLPSSPMMEQKEFHTPPIKTSAEMFSEYSKEPLSNIKIAHNGSKRKLFYTDNGDHHDNNNEEKSCHEEDKGTLRFSKRIRKTPSRYVEVA